MSDYVWYDDCFRAYKTEYGLWHTVSKEGRELVSGLTEDVCVRMTRFYLKGEQEGWGDKNSRVVNDGVVSGKL